VTTAARWAGSTLVGGLSGAGVGYMLARADLVPLHRALWACGAAGVLATLAVLGVHRRIRPRARPKPMGPPPDLAEVSSTPHEVEARATQGDRWP